MYKLFLNKYPILSCHGQLRGSLGIGGNAKERWEWIIAISGLAALGFVLIGIAHHSARVVPLHDEIGHLLVARDSLTRPHLLFNTWGRTINTLFYIPVSYAPLFYARIWASLLSICAIAAAWWTARRERVPGAFLIPWFCLLQPQMLENAWGALTEPPFMLMVMLSWLFWTNRKWKMSALCAGSLPLVRHEGIAISFILFVYLIFRRRWGAGLLCLLPVLVNAALGWLFFGDNTLSIFVNPKPTDHWGRGELSNFLLRLIQNASWPISYFALFGIVEMLRRPSRHRALMALFAFAGIYFLIHAVLYKFGLFATGGLNSFLLPLAPALGVLAAEGASWLLRHTSRELRKRDRPAPIAPMVVGSHYRSNVDLGGWICN